jgi:hypothetical protein
MSNCYNCKHRGTVPGSAHSSCTLVGDQTKQLLLFFQYLKGDRIMLKDKTTEEVIPLLKLDPHGVKEGWANWPIDFDPVWVSECQAFSLIENVPETIS